MTRLFSEVLQMSLSAGFLVGIIIGLRWCFRRAPKWVHCMLWALVAVRLIFPSLPQSKISMVPERVSDGEAIVQMVEEMPRFAPAPPAEPAPVPIAPVLPEGPAAVPEAPAQEINPPIPWMTVFSCLWLAGVALMASYALFSYVRILRKVGPCMDAGNGVFLCDYIDTPFLLGFHRPRIYLPSYLDGETASYVLAHERAHLARRDHWWKPIGFILLSIHWFNPMIWVGYILLCRDIEMACDEAVIRELGSEDKRGYSSALLRCSLPRRTVSICPLAFGEVSVKERIRSVLSYRRPALWLTLLAVTAVILGAVFFLTNPEKKDAPEKPEYLETAIYIASRDELTTIEYDDEHRPIRKINYSHGAEDYRMEYSYKRRGSTLTRTVVCTHALCTDQSGSPSSHSISTDGVDVRPGETVTMVYEEKLDQNDNVLESILTVDGQWARTQTCTYDEKGSILTKTVEAWEASDLRESRRTQTVTFTYDEQGNMLSQTNVADDARRDSHSVIERKWTRDDDGNVLRFQLIWDGKAHIDERYTLDENGHTVARTDVSSDGTSTTYSIVRDEALGREIVTQSGPDGDSTGIYFYDQRENWLSSYSRGENGAYRLDSARNYIGTDGFKSTGIPDEIYTEGQAVTAYPGEYTIPAPEEESAAPERTFYPTAKYDQSTDTLTLYQYSSSFQLLSSTVYTGGEETAHTKYSFVTVGPGEDITALTPGFNQTAYIYQKLDDQGRIAESVHWQKGSQWGSTHRYSYDESGNITQVVGMNPQRIWLILLTEQGHYCVWFAESTAQGPAIPETDWRLDSINGKKIRKNRIFLSDIVFPLDLYTHQIDERINDIDTVFYGSQTFSYNDSLRTETMEIGSDTETGYTQVNYFDSLGNIRNITTYYGDGRQNRVSYNYLAADGTQSIGIPREVSLTPAPVSYYPSASYSEETDLLTLYDYDDQHRLIQKTAYQDGRTVSNATYRYSSAGDTLTVTEQTAEKGENTQSVYTKKLDSSGNVTESTCYRNGAWDSTYQYTYDSQGNIATVDGWNTRQGFQITSQSGGYRIRYSMEPRPAAEDGPFSAQWIGIVNDQENRLEKWYLPAFVDELLYFHDFDQHLLSLGECHDGGYSWNSGSNAGPGTKDKSYILQIRREDASLVEGQIVDVDEHENPVRTMIYHSEDPDARAPSTYYNYISTLGTQSGAIPAAVFSDQGWDSAQPDPGAEAAKAAADLCAEALKNLAQERNYLTETLEEVTLGQKTTTYRSRNLRHGNDFLLERYNEDAQAPFTVWMRKDYLKSIRETGSWKFWPELPEASLTSWYEQYEYSPEDLTLLSDTTDKNIREITFRAAPRPGREEDQRDHTVTFRLDGSFHNLIGIEQTGCYTNYNGQKVEVPYRNSMTVSSTAAWTVAAEFLKQDVNSCENFTTPDLKAFEGGENVKFFGLQNKAPSPVTNATEAYRRARNEVTIDYNAAQVFRDPKAKLWRVDFRNFDCDGVTVYLNDQGITQVLIYAVAEFMTEEPFQFGLSTDSDALNECRQVLYQLQQSDSYHVALGEGDHPTQFYRHGDDILQMSYADEGVVQGTFNYLRRGSETFRIEYGGTDKSGDALTWEADHGLPPEVGDFHPWLYSFSWQDFCDVRSCSQQLTETGRIITVELSTPYTYPGSLSPVADKYQVEFYFDKEWYFQKAVLEGFFRYEAAYSEYDGIQHHTMTVVSTDEAQIAAQIEEQYQRAVGQNRK